ncbi:transmembrane alpha-helix [Fusarium longipes]|uniref:Transmembrane alpha-helix n=1 Tax=Fusarium longipes TaxID=694270 RepID=A0A395T9V1_9HYPO|nr:transmembrane alpha-helix [Fusarium longipes]
MSTLEPATDLDPNVWYQMSELAVDTADKDLHAMLQPTDSGSGGGDMRVGQANKNSYWQFQKIGDKPGRYQMRCSLTTVEKQLAVCYRPDIINEKRRTRPCLMATDDTEEQQWDVSLWGKDDSYRITNVHNGTKWNLDCIPNGPVFMSSNHEGDQPRQQWLMQSVGKVDNTIYSTIYSAPPKSTGDSTATTAASTADNSDTTATADPSDGKSGSSSNSGGSSNSNNSGNSNGLSSGAVAGISVATTLAVVALAIAGFFFWRRNKRKHSPVASSDPSDDKHNNSPIVVTPGDGVGSYHAPEKMSGASEMPPDQRPAELPNGRHQRHELA